MKTYSYSPRRQRPSSGGWTSILLFYVLPFIVINGLIFFLVTAKPKCQLSVGETNDYQSTTVTLAVRSILPVKSMSVTMNSQELELTSAGKKTYTATVTSNGVVDVTLVGLNGMSSRTYIQVSILDDTPPSIQNPAIETGVLTFQIEDSQSGVDYSSIYAIDSTGNTVQPLSIDRDTATVSFEMDSAGLNIYAKDLSGNETQTNLKSRIEGSEEVIDSSENNVGDDAAESSAVS